LIHIGHNYAYAPLPVKDTEERLRGIIGQSSNGTTRKLKKGFILHVGGNQWYKNRLGVVQIYAQVCENVAQAPTLVMAGKPFTPELKRSILRYHLQDRVLELNAVSNEDLRTLYCAAEILLFPSIAEGFGWPIIEAQACGCPVVIAKREPMNEIGGDAAFCFELESDNQHEDAPLSKRSAENAAKAVKEALLETGEARKNRVQKGGCNAARFSTARMVNAYIDLYKRMLRKT
jgi:glycosyltransferase involved in cell wall biosynthesis